MQLALFAAFSLAGVLVGGVLQYVLTRRAEHHRNIQLRRTEAYVDLIKAATALAQAPREAGGDAVRPYQVLAADARIRIAIYGSARVVTSLVAYLDAAGARRPEAGARLVELVRAMRLDGLGTGPVLPDAELQQLLARRE